MYTNDIRKKLDAAGIPYQFKNGTIIILAERQGVRVSDIFSAISNTLTELVRKYDPGTSIDSIAIHSEKDGTAVCEIKAGGETTVISADSQQIISTEVK